MLRNHIFFFFLGGGGGVCPPSGSANELVGMVLLYKNNSFFTFKSNEIILAECIYFA